MASPDPLSTSIGVSWLSHKTIRLWHVTIRNTDKRKKKWNTTCGASSPLLLIARRSSYSNAQNFDRAFLGEFSLNTREEEKPFLHGAAVQNRQLPSFLELGWKRTPHTEILHWTAQNMIHTLSNRKTSFTTDIVVLRHADGCNEWGLDSGQIH